MQFPLESWIVLGVFLINLLFLLIMSFISPYYEEVTKKGRGRTMNIMWIIIIIGAATILMMHNVKCTLDGKCRYMAAILTGILVVLSIGHIVWVLRNDARYRDQLAIKK
jgi:hypothetical protein